jgi:hypothetical protein
MKLLYSIILVALSLAVSGQRDTSLRIGLGLFANFYMADDATASFYNGSDNNRLQTLFNDPLTRNRIEDALGGFSFDFIDYAGNMVYNNAFAFEIELEYRFLRNWRASLQFVNAQLQATGNFTLRVNRRNTNNQTLDPYLENVSVSGTETRSHIKIGAGRIFPFSGGFYALAEGGFNMNFIEVNSNQVIIAERNFALPLFNNQLNMQAQQITTFGSGFFLAGGLGYELANGYGFIFKATYLSTSININDAIEANSNLLTIGVGLTKAW